jgi:hypothetical protein
MAPSHGMHDHSSSLVCLLFGRLHHLSCARWREIFRIYRLARGDLLSATGLARPAGVCNAAAGDFDTCSRFSSPMGSAQAGGALDHPNLALRVGHGGSRLFNALQMVPSTGRDAGDPACKLAHTRSSPPRSQNLALDGDLMFDQDDAPPRMKETLW